MFAHVLSFAFRAELSRFHLLKVVLLQNARTTLQATK